MPEVWIKIFKENIKSYEAIKHLEKQGIASDDDVAILYHNLLEDIIVTMRSEVEDGKLQRRNKSRCY